MVTESSDLKLPVPRLLSCLIQVHSTTINVLKISNALFFHYQGWNNKMLVRITKREDQDQTASWSTLFVKAFLAGSKCSKI